MLFKKDENVKKFPARSMTIDGQPCKVSATVRYNDDCSNGHNTLSVTGLVKWDDGSESFGCCHEEIAAAFPELIPAIEFHLCSSDGPLHYVANTTYHAKRIPEKQNKWYFYLEGKLIKIVGLEERNAMRSKYGLNAKFEDVPNPMAKEPDFDAARRTAIWPDAEEWQLTSETELLKRLPQLLERLKSVVKGLGLEC